MDKKYIQNTDKREHQPFRLGVALSGGGARGLAHAGALKAIDEAGLKVDVIAGVSSGSVIATLYAAGIKPDAILEMFTNARFHDLAEFTIGKGGLLRIERFTNFITRCLGKYKNLEELLIPTHICVTNFDEGVPEIFEKGEIGPIMQASCSIPIVILPVMIDGVNYVDGGVLRNLPAWAIRGKCDKLIGINVSPVLPKRVNPSILSMALRSYTLLAKSNQKQDMDMCNTVVTVDSVSQHKALSLKDLPIIFESGYQKMKAALEADGYV